jgi:hypothetical protein
MRKMSVLVFTSSPPPPPISLRSWGLNPGHGASQASYLPSELHPQLSIYIYKVMRLSSHLAPFLKLLFFIACTLTQEKMKTEMDDCHFCTHSPSFQRKKGKEKPPIFKDHFL